MAGETGLEPATSAVTGRRSNQLSYSPGKALSYQVLRRERSNTIRPSPSQVR